MESNYATSDRISSGEDASVFRNLLKINMKAKPYVDSIRVQEQLDLGDGTFRDFPKHKPHCDINMHT
jgi:hypothetical protein